MMRPENLPVDAAAANRDAWGAMIETMFRADLLAASPAAAPAHVWHWWADSSAPARLHRW
jgi:hypothetical protein